MLLKALLTEDLKIGLSLRETGCWASASCHSHCWLASGLVRSKGLSSLLSLMIPLPNEKS